MPFDINDDECIAKSLAQDAKNSIKTYDLVGLDAFSPKRARAGAPKPNTNFLRHIIRQTDSHNAALLAKEAEESSLRLRQMNRGMAEQRTQAVDRAKKRIEGRLSPPPKDEDTYTRRSRRRDDQTKDNSDHKQEKKRKRQDNRSDSETRRHRDRSRDKYRHKRQHRDNDEDRAIHKSRRSRDHRNDRHQHRHDNEEKERMTNHKSSHDRSRRRKKSCSRSPSRSQSRSPCQNTHRKSRRYERPQSPRRSPHNSRTSPRSPKRSATPASDSDPLEAIVGPLPLPPEPTVRSRGRGALKANFTGIDSVFSSTYDPSTDVRPKSDAEDDWDEALEVMRDRERWKQQGASRLRAAGFKDEQVKKWEKGGDPTEEDVIWSKKGQDREWDRGKVVDKDGDVELKAEWGRLK